MHDRIDETDRRILALLQQDSAATIQRIAAMIGLSASTVHERIRKLETRTSEGHAELPTPATHENTSDQPGPSPVILAYEARLDPAALGLGLLAFVFVRADERVGVGEAGRCLAAIPEVQEVHHIAGEDCYLVKLRTQDTASLGRLLRERFAAIPAIRSTRTTIVLETIKETARLPIATDASGAVTNQGVTAPDAGVVNPVAVALAATSKGEHHTGAQRLRPTRTPSRTAARRTTHTAQRRESI